MDQLLPFLKKYSDIDIDFIEQFIQIKQGDNLYAPFTIDLDIVAKWLKTRKRKLKETLVNSYVENVDYIIIKLGAPKGAAKWGGHNTKNYFVIS